MRDITKTELFYLSLIFMGLGWFGGVVVFALSEIIPIMIGSEMFQLIVSFAIFIFLILVLPFSLIAIGLTYFAPEEGE